MTDAGTEDRTIDFARAPHLLGAFGLHINPPQDDRRLATRGEFHSSVVPQHHGTIHRIAELQSVIIPTVYSRPVDANHNRKKR